jgi:hypothetical protein
MQIHAYADGNGRILPKKSSGKERSMDEAQTLARKWTKKRLSREEFLEQVFCHVFNPWQEDALNQLRGAWCYLWLKKMERAIQLLKLPVSMPDEVWSDIRKLFDMPDDDPKWKEALVYLLETIDSYAEIIAHQGQPNLKWEE